MSTTKHFVMLGLLPQPFEGAPVLGGGDLSTTREARTERWPDELSPMLVEGEYVFFRHPTLGKIYRLVHDVYDALLLVAAPSQAKAYQIALPFRAFVSVYLGFQPFDQEEQFLLELINKPSPMNSRLDIAKLQRPDLPPWTEPTLLVMSMGSGPVLPESQVQAACDFTSSLVSSPYLSSTLLHLEQSHNLFAGFMTGSFYRYHYSQERKEETPYYRAKKLLELRTRYDLAFLSAFRALESLLHVPQAKKNQVRARLAFLDKQFGTDFGSGHWVSYHEVFSSRRRRWRYEELICRYLEVRNAVAAHSNLQRPFPLTEDQVLELQLLVQGMLSQVVGEQ